MMGVRIFLSVITIFTLVHLTTAKFEQVYAGIAFRGVQACLANSTWSPETMQLRRNCGEAFQCVMDKIPNSSQSILSSGSAIIGFASLPAVVGGFC